MSKKIKVGEITMFEGTKEALDKLTI